MATTTGAIATVDSDRPPPLPLDSIPIIDLSLLSQSELYSLSMCSNSPFDLNRCDDVVIPKIDPSVFNESAGSRKQTYSRLRLAPAQSSTSTNTTIHRRTPRLRTSHTPTPNNINGAEQAENSEIIHMLKKLFKSDHNFEDLVPIEVEMDTNVAVPQFVTPETNRKRGRPRSNENAVFIHPPAAKRVCNNTVTKVVAYDADRDKAIVNSRGVKVDLKNLGKLEDPYGIEIRRRTQGMSTKDELLGFLGGLNGDWGTSRKKKKVVDACNFGDALPKGWRLSLSIKKKLGRVWLICRRYISPSGRQFESCKEVSLYLLSLVGEENLGKSTHSQSNNCDDCASNDASVNTNVSIQEAVTRKRSVVLALSTSSPRDFKKQVKSKTVDPIGVQVKEVFKCLKCFMIFKGKVKLLDHQMLAHKTETCKLGSETSEWVVVKGGIFECQFCNKTFNERNQYNEHIRTHGAIDKKTSEASNAEKIVVMESHDATFGDKLVSSSSSQGDDKISCGTESEVKGHVHDLNIQSYDNQREHVNMNEDVLVEKSGGEVEEKCNVDDKKSSEASEASAAEKTVVMEIHDASFGVELLPSSSQSDDKIRSESEINDHVHDVNIQSHDEDVVVEKCGGEIEEKCNVDDIKTFEASEASTAEKSVVMESHDDAPFGNKLVSSSSQGDDKISCETESEINEHVHDLNILAHDNQCESVNINEDDLVEKSGGEIENKCNEDEIEFTEIEKDPNFSVSKSGFCLGNEASMSFKEINGNLESSVGTVDCVDDKCNEGLNGQYAVSETGVTHVDNKLECIPEKGESCGNTHNESLNLADSETRVQSPKICEKRGFWENINDAHICTSFDDLTSEKENHVAEMKKKKKVPDSETESLSLVTRDFEYGIANSRVDEEYVNNVVGSKVEEPQTQINIEDFHIENVSLNRSTEVNLDDFHLFTNDEPIYNNEDTGVLSFNSGKNLEFCSLVPNANEQEFSFQDDDDDVVVDVSGLYETGQRGFLDHFSIPETYDDMFDEDRGIGIHDLSLAFGDPHDQKKDGSKIDDVQTDLSMVNNSSNSNGFFRVDEQQQRYNKYNDGFGLNGFRSGRSEPTVEFSFLTGRSEGVVGGSSSAGFPYNNNNNNTASGGMEEGFGSGFWSGKNGTSVIITTSVCPWCRNEFHLLPEAQQQGGGGGVASLCPSCSAGMSGQVNML